MSTVEIPREIDRFVLHFDTTRHQVNAYALSTALVGLANAIKEANAIVNPGHAIEVVVEKLEDGSFRATIKTITTKAKNIFSQEAPKAIIYGLMVAWIYDHTIAPDKSPTIIVNDGSVIIKSGDDTIIVPRDVYDAKQQVEKSERFENSMGQVFSGALLDNDVTGLKITPEGSWPGLPLIPRDQFHAIIDLHRSDDNNAVLEDANLEISRAILSRGKRKWEFYWRGIRIAAPVLDEHFYDNFFNHSITIAPGDILKASLKIHRRIDPDSGIMINTRYEVVQVYEHIPRQTQTSF